MSTFSSGRYMVSDGWEHIFEDGGRAEITRWVYDTENATLYAQVQSDPVHARWSVLDREATQDLKCDVHDNDVIDTAGDWGVIFMDQLPGWAANAVAFH